MAPAPADQSMALSLAGVEVEAARLEFTRQGSFIHVTDFIPPDVTAELVGAVATLTQAVNRNYLPGHKQGGSVSRHVIDNLTPFVADLYRSAPLIRWLSSIAGEPLQLSPLSDPHAYAFYFYTRPGDHIGWHYDTSYYVGRRYTVLIGVVDNSSCRLDYQLHTREPGATMVANSLRLAPGSLCFFDGDKLRHRITPLGDGEERVSLTFEYVTDPSMHPGRRLISNMKDAFGYFGFRQVFGGAKKGGRGGGA